MSRPYIVAPPASALPPEPADVTAALEPVVDLLAGRTVVALTGAGVSTDSGVPDYRSPGSPPRRPMTLQEFLAGDEQRRHYWARNHLGWRHLRAVEPNAGHEALAHLEREGIVNGVITQNIDLLHLKAGSRNVVHLHGRYDRVVCRQCGAVITRESYDDTLSELNPGWRERHVSDVEVAPDADAALESTADFRVAACAACGGILMPDVVFFGDTVPRVRVDAARAMVEEAGAMLVAGSSLAVMSGLRFARQTAKADNPVVIITRGATRGDDLAAVKVQMSTTTALPHLAAALQRRRS